MKYRIVDTYDNRYKVQSCTTFSEDWNDEYVVGLFGQYEAVFDTLIGAEKCLNTFVEKHKEFEKKLAFKPKVFKFIEL